MLQGIAYGGPRDGVKLTAGLRWNGRVQQPRKEKEAIKWFPGHYGWDWDFKAWVWHADKPAKAEKAGTPKR